MNNQTQIYDLCNKHMHGYVMVETTNGMKQDGIITGIDEQNVYMAVPIDECVERNQEPVDEQQSRHYHGYGSGYGYQSNYQYGGYPGYGYGGGYGYPGYGYGYGGQSRFRRLILPLAAVTALAALPWY